MVNRLSTHLGNVCLDNPVIPASGTFGFGLEMAEIYDINLLGSISIKGTTREARYGNPLPRIAEATSGILNSVGLQNPGVDAVIAEELPKLRQVFHKPIISNISGFSIEDYTEACQKMNGEDQVEIIEVNVSCPKSNRGKAARLRLGGNAYDVRKVSFPIPYEIQRLRPCVLASIGPHSPLC